MGIEGGSSNNEIQSQEINQSNNEQAEINQAEHQRSGEELEGNSTIDNEGERKQIEGKDEAENLNSDEASKLDNDDTIEDDSSPEQQESDQDNNPEQMQLDNQDTIEDESNDNFEAQSDNINESDSLDSDETIEDDTEDSIYSDATTEADNEESELSEGEKQDDSGDASDDEKQDDSGDASDGEKQDGSGDAYDDEIQDDSEDLDSDDTIEDDQEEVEDCSEDEDSDSLDNEDSIEDETDGEDLGNDGAETEESEDDVTEDAEAEKDESENDETEDDEPEENITEDESEVEASNEDVEDTQNSDETDEDREEVDESDEVDDGVESEANTDDLDDVDETDNLESYNDVKDFNNELNDVYADKDKTNQEKVEVAQKYVDKLNNSDLSPEAKRQSVDAPSDARALKNIENSDWTEKTNDNPWPPLNIDFPDKMGLDCSRDISPIGRGDDTVQLPEFGYRYGGEGGYNYTCRAEDGHIPSLDERSLPKVYVPEKDREVHFDNVRYCDAIDAIRDSETNPDGSLEALNNIIDDINAERGIDKMHLDEYELEALNDKYKQLQDGEFADVREALGVEDKDFTAYGVHGYAKPMEDVNGDTICEGGANQFNTALPEYALKRIGVEF